MKNIQSRKWRENIEAIRRFIDASSLMSVMELSETFQNQKLELIIFPVGEYEYTEEDFEMDKRTLEKVFEV